MSGLQAGVGYELRHYRVDASHSNISDAWARIGGGADWPSGNAQWAELRAADRLDELRPAEHVSAAGGSWSALFDLPMPAISYLELRPSQR
jgi:xylan 1,4-beta-xylosidase